MSLDEFLNACEPKLPAGYPRTIRQAEVELLIKLVRELKSQRDYEIDISEGDLETHDEAIDRILNPQPQPQAGEGEK